MEEWKIRYEGKPTNPRYRTNKRRTAAIYGTEEQANNYAEDLRKYQGCRILWIKKIKYS